METQTRLSKGNIFKPVIKLQKNPLSLEREKERFIQNMCNFLDPLNFESMQEMGRPRADFKDIAKAFLVMSYNSMSYRRTQSDLKKMHEEGLIKIIPSRSTLNEYANNLNSEKLIEKLIQASALFFADNEDTIILDSTWFSKKMYGGGYKKVHDKKHAPLDVVRKLHVVCLKNSRIIAYAKATKGTEHDSPHFEDMVNSVCKKGFNIRTLLADAGYSSKNNFVICRENGINNVFIDFRSNASVKRAKSDIWREKLKLYKEKKEVWNESYRFRVLIEGVFSAIKRKNLNYLRSKTEIAQNVELLLKALVYNITIMGKYS